MLASGFFNLAIGYVNSLIGPQATNPDNPALSWAMDWFFLSCAATFGVSALYGSAIAVDQKRPIMYFLVIPAAGMHIAAIYWSWTLFDEPQVSQNLTQRCSTLLYYIQFIFFWALGFKQCANGWKTLWRTEKA